MRPNCGSQFNPLFKRVTTLDCDCPTVKNAETKSALRHLVTALKFGASILILAWLFYEARENSEFENLWTRDKQWGWVGLAFLATLIAHLIGFVRWRVMVRALDLPFRMGDAIRIGFIGAFFNTFTIGVIGGDALRAFYVTREMEDRTSEAISSVIADRIVGLLTMFTIASIMFLLSDLSSISSGNPQDLANVSKVCKFALICTVLGYLGMATVFCAPWLTRTKWFASLLKIPMAGGIIEKLTNVALAYRSRPGVVALSFLLSVGINLAFAVAIYSLAIGLTDTHPSFLNHLVIEPIAMVSNAVPLPGGIGGMEWATNFLYNAFGSTSGFIVAFGFRITLLFVTVIGACYWFLNKNKVSEVMGDGSADKPLPLDQ